MNMVKKKIEIYFRFVCVVQQNFVQSSKSAKKKVVKVKQENIKNVNATRAHQSLFSN